jgi:hypothetical protein
VTVVVGVAYALTLGLGFARHGFAEPIADPILAVMELLTIASAVPLFLVFFCVHALAPQDARGAARLALGFGAAFAITTTAVHLEELSYGRLTGQHGMVWPSVPYAIELVAWDVLLGVALLGAATAMRWDGGARRVQAWLQITGLLCLLGIAGPLTGDMRVQRVGVLGYAVLLPVTCWMLRGRFRARVTESRAAL